MRLVTRAALAAAVPAALSACTAQLMSGGPMTITTTVITTTATTAAVTATRPALVCTPEQVDVTTAERPGPVPGDELFAITFTARAGVECTLEGTPDDLVFLSGADAPLDVRTEFNRAGADRVLVTPDRPKVVHVAAPDQRLPGAPAAKARFSLPGGAGGPVTVPWPGDLNGPVMVTAVGDEVG